MKIKVGDIITVINPSMATASVLVVGRVGRRYLWVRGTAMPHDATLWRVDMGDNIILPGNRSDVVECLIQLDKEYWILDQERWQERDNAIGDFRKKWNAEHPSPPYLVAAYIKQLREEAESWAK